MASGLSWVCGDNDDTNGPFTSQKSQRVGNTSVADEFISKQLESKSSLAQNKRMKRRKNTKIQNKAKNPNCKNLSVREKH